MRPGRRWLPTWPGSDPKPGSSLSPAGEPRRGGTARCKIVPDPRRAARPAVAAPHVDGPKLSGALGPSRRTPPLAACARTVSALRPLPLARTTAPDPAAGAESAGFRAGGRPLPLGGRWRRRSSAMGPRIKRERSIVPITEVAPPLLHRCAAGALVEIPAATYSPRGLPPKYHRRWRSSLPCSEWERVFPRRNCHRKPDSERSCADPSRAPERARAFGRKIPSPRPISTGRLNTSPCVHLRPINLVVYQGPYPVNPVGDLISRQASRLDAFSAYPFRR